MKKNLQLFALLCFGIICQSCGPKTEATNTDTVDSVSTSTAASEELDQSKKMEAIATKRATIEKARAEKIEQRRIASEEKAKASMTYKDASGKVVYNKAEIDPSFTGGNKAMMKYLRDNLKYPADARDKGVEGTVFVNFIVDEKGKVREVVASDVVGDDIDQALKDESVRVVTSMPVWVAGRQHGKNVDVNFSIPITFELSN